MLEGVWRKGNPPTSLARLQVGTSTMETIWKFLRKLNIKLAYDPTIPLLGIYLDKSTIQEDTCNPAFNVALFTIAKTCKQPKCPSIDKGIRKMCYIDTMEYYSARKKNEVMPFAATWIQLEILILSEVRKRKTNAI